MLQFVDLARRAVLALERIADALEARVLGPEEWVAGLTQRSGRTTAHLVDSEGRPTREVEVGSGR